MRILRTRDDLIALIVDHAPTTACETAIRENRVTVLGGFNPVEGFPGWIMVILSRFNKEWIVAVLADEPNQKYLVKWIDKVPYENWIGVSCGRPSLINGDRPRETAYKRIRSRHANALISIKHKSADRRSGD